MILRIYRLLSVLLFPVVKFFRPVFPSRWDMAERLNPGLSSGNPALWLHGASLGEARALWALARTLKWPGKLILTTTTVSGRDWLEHSSATGGREGFGGSNLLVRLMPLDHPTLVRNFISHNRIRIALFYEMELWPNTLSELRQAGVPAMWVSARLTAKAARIYGLFRKSSRALMNTFAFIQARSEEDAGRLRLFGIKSEPGFDFKAAHYLTRPPQSGQNRTAFTFLSLHAEELRLLLPVLPGLMEKCPVLIFPRRVREFARFRSLLAPLGFALFSRGEKGPNLLVDALGEIEQYLPRCHSAFVGGTLIPLGGHNLWEPLSAGLKIYFGPYVFNQEPLAGELIRAGLAESVSGALTAGNLKIPSLEISAQSREFLEVSKTRLIEAMGSLNVFVRDYL